MASLDQRRLDIGQVLDSGPWTGLQKVVVCLAASAIVLDGFDGQLIGFAPSVANAGLTAYNMGGVVGALPCASLIPRFGSRRPIVVCAVRAAASALALRVVPNDQAAPLVAGLGLHGLFVNAVNSSLCAVGAFLYPTEIRARGTTTALAIGRLGVILSAFAGAAVLMAVGSSGFPTILGASMLVVVATLLVLRRHIGAQHGTAGSIVAVVAARS